MNEELSAGDKVSLDRTRWIDGPDQRRGKLLYGVADNSPIDELMRQRQTCLGSGSIASASFITHSSSRFGYSILFSHVAALRMVLAPDVHYIEMIAVAGSYQP